MVTSPQMIPLKDSWWVWCVSAFPELFDTVVDKTDSEQNSHVADYAEAN